MGAEFSKGEDQRHMAALCEWDLVGLHPNPCPSERARRCVGEIVRMFVCVDVDWECDVR